MEFVAIITLVAIMEYTIFGFFVGRARQRSGLQAPAISGDPEFERYFRVQQNTLENLAIFLPSLWIFSSYVNPIAGSALGLLFVIGRAIYCRAYVKDPAKRGPGFLIGYLATVVLMVGALIGAIWSLF